MSFLLYWMILPSFVTSIPLWSLVCQEDHPASHLPFCDSTWTLEQRVEDYVNRIPVEQQIAMMSHRAAGYDRLGIPPYQWWSEGLHGPLEPCVEWNNQTRCPTSFPCPSGLGNAFNTTLYRHIGTAIGMEGRAISQLRSHNMDVGDGLTYWSPNVNLQRDPRWGRNQEAPGEDPLLTSQYARNFVQGLQQAQSQDDPLHVAACCKHFVANSLESWMGHTRHNFDARVSEADLQNYYFKPFQECVQAGAAGVMCSYNAINGVPACIHSDLLDTTLRQSWGFMGYLVTDCGALVDTITGHGAAKDPVDASAKAKRATVDVNCGDIFQEGLLAAYQAGLVQDSTIVDSFRRLARIQFRLGLFDPKEYRPDDAISLVGSHSQLALEAARQSIVLLKNTHNILPFDQNQKIAMIGPHIYGKDVFLSNYHGEVCPDDTGTSYDCMTTPVEVFSKATNHFINTTLGCHVDDSDLDEIDKAVEIAKEADIVVLLVGLSQRQEREEKDRTETVLPGLQQELINAVLNVACNKTVIAMIHGGAISLGHNILSKSAAILSASYGGMQGAQALADVMFGRYNPSGKLAATMYPASYVQDIPLTEMGLNVGVGRTHMYYSGTPEFSFGHGLSYSTWTIDWAKNESTIDEPSWALHNSRSSLMLQVNVTNVGPMKGSQNVLLFWRLPGNDRVRQKLAGFQGTGVLDVGESAALKFEISYQTFALWSEEIGSFLPDVGLYELEFRTSSGVLRHFVRVSLPTDNSTESTF